MASKEATDRPPDEGGEGSTSQSNIKGLRNRKDAKRNDEAGENTRPGLIEEPQTNDTSTHNANEQPPNASGIPGQQVPEPPEILYIPANRVIIAIPRWICWTLFGIFAIMFIALGGYIGDKVYRHIYLIPDFNPNAGLERVIGEDGVTFFRQYDRDGDSQLSMDEFEAMYYRFLGEGLNVTSLREYIQPIDVDDEVVTAKAYFQPLVLDTMTKDLNESVFNSDLDSLVGLKAWREKSKEWINAGVKHFVSFLPREDSYITDVGSIYDIYRIDTGLFALFDTQMTSSNRYFPPNVEDNLVLIHRLLTMFHPRPFLRTRFAPQGAIATVRAYNDKYIDIVFRIHAEFQINEPPHYPFWFSPAQFKGNLIISRDYKHIVYFHMYVPTDKRLNIDMEWLNGPQEMENMEVDIGFLPQMEINITGPSVPYQAGIQDTPIPGDRDKIDKELSNIKWTKEITMHQAERNLEIHLYPFKKIVYHNFTDAFEVAKKENRLVHHILLWGALDDQSC